MITANDARQLVAISTTEVDRYVSLIEVDILKLANQGKRRYPCYVDGLWDAIPVYSFTEPSQLQKNVIMKLAKFGFHTVLGKDGDEYVPCGMGEDGERFVNLCLIITW